MAVIIRCYGNGSPGLDTNQASSPIDPALFTINALTSTQAVMSVNFQGQTYSFNYSGTFDLSGLGGVIPANLGQISTTSIPNAVTSFTLSSGGQTKFSETFSPASNFNQVGDILDHGQKMVAALSGNDVYYSSSDATGSNNDSVYLYAGNDTYYVNHA